MAEVEGTQSGEAEGHKEDTAELKDRSRDRQSPAARSGDRQNGEDYYYRGHENSSREGGRSGNRRENVDNKDNRDNYYYEARGGPDGRGPQRNFDNRGRNFGGPRGPPRGMDRPLENYRQDRPQMGNRAPYGNENRSRGYRPYEHNETFRQTHGGGPRPMYRGDRDGTKFNNGPRDYRNDGPPRAGNFGPVENDRYTRRYDGFNKYDDRNRDYRDNRAGRDFPPRQSDDFRNKRRLSDPDYRGPVVEQRSFKEPDLRDRITGATGGYKRFNSGEQPPGSFGRDPNITDERGPNRGFEERGHRFDPAARPYDRTRRSYDRFDKRFSKPYDRPNRFNQVGNDRFRDHPERPGGANFKPYERGNFQDRGNAEYRRSRDRNFDSRGPSRFQRDRYAGHNDDMDRRPSHPDDNWDGEKVKRELEELKASNTPLPPGPGDDPKQEYDVNFKFRERACNLLVDPKVGECKRKVCQFFPCYQRKCPNMFDCAEFKNTGRCLRPKCGFRPCCWENRENWGKGPLKR